MGSVAENSILRGHWNRTNQLIHQLDEWGTGREKGVCVWSFPIDFLRDTMRTPGILFPHLNVSQWLICYWSTSDAVEWWGTDNESHSITFAVSWSTIGVWCPWNASPLVSSSHHDRRKEEERFSSWCSDCKRKVNPQRINWLLVQDNGCVDKYSAHLSPVEGESLFLSLQLPWTGVVSWLTVFCGELWNHHHQTRVNSVIAGNILIIWILFDEYLKSGE